MAMNSEVKAQWVAALRSGEYKQGKGQLRLPTGEYCCLGVLTDLAVKAGACAWGTDVVGEDGDLIDLVIDWSGLNEHIDDDADPADPLLGDRHATSLNDSGASFSGIADLIEQYL